jgi:hypothetical protein
VFSLLFITIVSLLLNGCAAVSKMALEDGSAKELESDKPIFIMSVNLRNQYKTNHQPKLTTLNVEQLKANGDKDKLNFSISEKGSKLSEDPNIGNRYLLRFQLDKGDYVIRGMTCISTGLLIYGSFFTPIHEQLTASAPGIYYLGNIDATVRQRNEESNEFKAGSSIPLIDQSVVGASGGTFDIKISDKWEQDKLDFLADFPILNSVQISKAVLPEFDRQRAQIWWEEH